MLDDFHAAHQKRFGYQHIGKKVEAVTFRVRGSLPQEAAARRTSPPKSAQQSRVDLVNFGGKPTKTTILQRESLPTDFSARGPMIVNEYTATTVVPPDWSLTVHRSGSMLLDHLHSKKRTKKRRPKLNERLAS